MEFIKTWDGFQENEKKATDKGIKMGPWAQCPNLGYIGYTLGYALGLSRVENNLL